MNKDVLYIEPEDDITDIITKIENSKETIVALVPPKKAGVFRSVVNIKLIAKAGTNVNKTIVLVTTDPSIVKLAAVTKLPVTKDLQSAPVVPTGQVAEVVETSETDIIEDDPGEEAKEANTDSTATTKSVNDLEMNEENDMEDTDREQNPEPKPEQEDEAQKREVKAIKDKKKPKKPKPISGNWFLRHKWLLIFGALCLVGISVFLVWAFVFAPAATISVEVNTTPYPFSESVSLTTESENENLAENRLYLEEKKIETVRKVDFEATGSKNIGEKAKGEVVIYAYFKNPNEGVAVNAGSTFSIDGLNFVSDKDATLAWNGDDVCENNSQANLMLSGCLISGRVAVTAAQPGSKYNISPSVNGWTGPSRSIYAYSDTAMSGGTDEIIRVVQQSDVEKARANLATTDEEENKEKLYESIEKDMLIIDSSFKQTATAAVSTPAVDEEVKDGVKPSLQATTITSVNVVNKGKINEYIKMKVNLDSDQKIYEIKNPFIESFTQTGSGYSGRLKATYATGPKLDYDEILEMTKGKGFGDAQHQLKGIKGVTYVNIDGSFPWVNTVPNDTNKIDVDLKVKEQS